MRRIVPVPMWCPSRSSSAWMRRCAHRGFSRARRITSSRSVLSMRGRPTGFGKVHFLVMRRRCQASSVAGVTSRWRRSSRGSSRASADRIARSGHAGRGRVIWRRRTAISWRGMSTSTINPRPAAREESQPAQYPQHEHVDKTHDHGRRSFLAADDHKICRSRPASSFGTVQAFWGGSLPRKVRRGRRSDLPRLWLTGVDPSTRLSRRS